MVALEDVLDGDELLLERPDRPGAIGVHTDEGGDVLAELARVQQRDVANYHTRLFELVDPLDHGRGRKPHLLADRGQRPLAVLLEQPEDGSIGGVKLGGIATGFH